MPCRAHKSRLQRHVNFNSACFGFDQRFAKLYGSCQAYAYYCAVQSLLHHYYVGPVAALFESVTSQAKRPRTTEPSDTPATVPITNRPAVMQFQWLQMKGREQIDTSLSALRFYEQLAAVLAPASLVNTGRLSSLKRSLPLTWTGR